jgi:adenosylcobinamide-phosphate synthase
VSGAPLLAGFAADLVAGDPHRLHPVAGFGHAALALERAAYAPSRPRGVLVAGALVAGAAVSVELLARAVSRTRLGRYEAVFTAVTWAALGGTSLRREARRVGTQLERNQLSDARLGLRALCGRDTTELDESEVSRAVVESVAENTSDAVVGALVWGAIAGPAGVAAYRASNTLDAMFGHHSERYEEFGWAAARLDDLMSWPAARLTAALTCLVSPLISGSPARTLAVVRRDGGAHPSPNAGRAEAAFAGALGLQLGGELAYSGRIESRPHLGDGRRPETQDIKRASRLSLYVGVSAALACAAFRTAVTGSAQ